MLEISTNNLKTRKQATIDGNVYTVRKFSNLEQLDISQYKRRSEKIQETIKDIKDEAEIEKLEAEADYMARRLNDMFVGLFDDGGDQSKSRVLVESLDYEGLIEMLGVIFENA